MRLGSYENWVLKLVGLETGHTARVCAFNEEERIADIALAKDAGSFACFFRSAN